MNLTYQLVTDYYLTQVHLYKTSTRHRNQNIRVIYIMEVCLTQICSFSTIPVNEMGTRHQMDASLLYYLWESMENVNVFRDFYLLNNKKCKSSSVSKYMIVIIYQHLRCVYSLTLITPLKNTYVRLHGQIDLKNIDLCAKYCIR